MEGINYYLIPIPGPESADNPDWLEDLGSLSRQKTVY